MIYATYTTTNMKTVKKELEEKAKKVGLGLLHTYEFKNILEEKGFPIEKDITVYELCNPHRAQQMLSQLPEISVYFPCRISVYEDTDITVLSTIGLEEIINTLEVDERFKSYIILLFENLKRLMHSWDK